MKSNRNPHVQFPLRQVGLEVRDDHPSCKTVSFELTRENIMAASMATGSISSDPVTLTRHLLMDKTTSDSKPLTVLMASIQLACKTISLAVRKAGIAGLYGLHGSVNATGDSVKKLDLLSNDVFLNALKYSRELSVLVSEELDDALVIEDALQGRYCVVTDPLDGSSNIDCNVSTGTIFGIYKIGENSSARGVEDVLRPGRELVAAGYCMYGSSTQLVLTTGNGVNGFTLDPSIGEFILTHPSIRIPAKPKTIYSVNEGNSRYWDKPTADFVDMMKNAKKPYSLRYVGSMVSDVHRTLLYGGVFMYPGDSKSKNGKLRLLYEGNPMSMLCEQAGGAATDGRVRILDKNPEHIHCRTPIFLGCKRDIEVITLLYRDFDSQKQAAPDAKKPRTSE